VKYAWIVKHKTCWPVTLICEVLQVSASGYFEHWRRKDTTKPSKQGVSKRISDEALLVHVKVIHAEVKQEYGWPKMRQRTAGPRHAGRQRAG
jgi:putative transposase